MRTLLTKAATRAATKAAIQLISALDQAAAIQDFHAAAAHLLTNDDSCRRHGALHCGLEHEMQKTPEWKASCHQAAKWRDLGRNYQGDAELVGKYKDANQFWEQYCSNHPDYSYVKVLKVLQELREAAPPIKPEW